MSAVTHDELPVLGSCVDCRSDRRLPEPAAGAAAATGVLEATWTLHRLACNRGLVGQDRTVDRTGTIASPRSATVTRHRSPVEVVGIDVVCVQDCHVVSVDTCTSPCRRLVRVCWTWCRHTRQVVRDRTRSQLTSERRLRTHTHSSSGRHRIVVVARRRTSGHGRVTSRTRSATAHNLRRRPGLRSTDTADG